MKIAHLFIAILSFGLLPALAEKPNILLIVADDMGYGDLSCYGSKQIKTPNLDRLAKNGVRCTDGYVSNAVCAPSRAGLLTGRYGSRFGFEHNLSQPSHIKDEFAGIPLDETLMSDRLKSLGYRTGMVGKWHLGEALPTQHPTARGFDFFFGMLGGGHSYFPTPEKNKLLFGDKKVSEIRTPYLTDWFTLEAMDFMKAEGKAKPADASEGDKPWFLYLSYNTPHSPMQAKAEDLEKFSHIKPKTRQIYCAMQHCMDVNIGKILQMLEARGELENTLIAFISDNGGSVEVSYAVNAPMRGTKGTFMEGGIRVPTIYHWPAKLKPQVYEKPVISLDLNATFVKAAGGEVPKVVGEGKESKIYDGVDLVPFLNGEKEGRPHQTLYWRAALRGVALRDGDWKLLIPNSMGAQLYHLADDPSEQKNLIAEHPEKFAELMEKKVDWEISLKRNPIFISAPFWTGYNKRLYDKTYSLVQPEVDSTENVWSFKRPKR